MEAPLQLAYYGAFAAGHVIAAAFFLRFSHKTKSTLFTIFAAAFLLLGISYGLLCVTTASEVEPRLVYLIRLGAFVLLIVGIIWTNIHQRKL
jgi:hypothetical protein